MFCNIPEVDQPGVSTRPVKTFGFFQMAHKAVPRAEFYFKTDEHTFPDMFDILSAIKEWEQSQNQSVGKRHYGGLLHQKSSPIRDPTSPWFVPKEAYGEDLYPDYHSGAFFYLTNSLARCVAESSTNPLLPYIPVEDAGVGILLKQFCQPFDIQNMYQIFDWTLTLLPNPVKYNERLEVIIQNSRAAVVLEVKGEGNLLRLYESRYGNDAQTIPRYTYHVLNQKFLDFCKHQGTTVP